MNVNADLSVMMMHTSKEGRTDRLAQPLKFVHHRMPALVLAWTVMHEIDEHSPLHGLDAAGLVAAEIRFMLTIEARDLELGLEVFDLKPYTGDMVLLDVAYRDLVTFDENENAHADLRLLSDTVPLTC